MSSSPRCQLELWTYDQLEARGLWFHEEGDKHSIIQGRACRAAKDGQRRCVSRTCQMPCISDSRTCTPFPPPAPHNTTSYLMRLHSCSSPSKTSATRHQRYAPKVKRRIDEVADSLDDEELCLDTFGSFISNRQGDSDSEDKPSCQTPPFKRRRFLSDISDIVRTKAADATDASL